jgi:hypothetical protein
MGDHFLFMDLSDLSPELVSEAKLVYFCEMNQVQRDEEKDPDPETSQQ